MGKNEEQSRRDDALQILQELEQAGSDDGSLLATLFNAAAGVLRETGQYKSDISRMARLAHAAQSAEVRRAAIDTLGAIAVEGGPYSGTATTALAVALEGGAAAEHPHSSRPDTDAGVRLRASVWLGQIGRRAPEGPEAFNCFMALSYAAKNDTDQETKLASVVGLGNIGKAKLATWAEDVIEAMHAARDSKNAPLTRLINREVDEILAALFELQMRNAGMAGGASPYIS
jgi:hypothetical protein